MDFQVQALIGAVHRGYNASATNQLEMYPYVFTGETSDWSPTQSVTIPASSVSPTPTLTVPEFSVLAFLPLFAFVLYIAAVLRYRKPKSRNIDLIQSGTFRVAFFRLNATQIIVER